MNKEIININNIIVGAGPSGLQLAYYFEKYHIEYVVLERNLSSGSRYKDFPQSNNLLSINKKNNDNQNEDYNLRYDWNSLINDENFLFTKYSNEYYPLNTDLHKYFNDFSLEFKLKIKYNENVLKISYNSELLKYYVETELVIYICEKLIIATGMSKPNIPICKKYIRNKNNIKHYSEFATNYFKDKNNLNNFLNKSVLLVGLGNSSLELAELLNNYCKNILITGKSRDFSINTHYDGDIRTKYMNFYDTFFFNNMNGIDNIILTEKEVIVENSNKESENYGKYYILTNKEDGIAFYNSIIYFDYIIFCTGYNFDKTIFDNNLNITMEDKYPKLNSNFESINNNKLYFIGSLMYGLEKNKCSIGFIRGFRYLIKLFFKKNYMITMDKVINFKFDGTFEIYNTLRNYIYNRINNSSSLFNLPNYLVDVFYYDKETQKINYYKDNIRFGLEINFIDHSETNYFCILKLCYSEKIDLFKNYSYNKFNPSLLHPEIEIFIKNENNIFVLKDKIIFEDNLVSNYSDKEIYYDKILRAIKYCIDII
jgi:thioredoxin reductase